MGPGWRVEAGLCAGFPSESTRGPVQDCGAGARRADGGRLFPGLSGVRAALTLSFEWVHEEAASISGDMCVSGP